MYFGTYRTYRSDRSKNSAPHVWRKKGFIYDPKNTISTMKYGGDDDHDMGLLLCKWYWGITHIRISSAKKEEMMDISR